MDSVVTDNTALPFSARYTDVSGDQAGIYARSELLWKYSMILFCTWCDHWVWLCVSEAVCL